MTTQQQAAQLVQQLHDDAATEAWRNAATNATVNMHPVGPQWYEGEAELAEMRQWYAERELTSVRARRPGRWLVRFGSLVLFGIGLALATLPVYIARTEMDGRWLGAAVIGWLIVCLVWRAWRAGK